MGVSELTFPASSREEHRRLQIALDPGAIAAYLGRGGETCRILDAKYEPGGGWTILYQLGDDIVLGVLGRDGHGGEGRSLLSEELGMRAYPFPHDPVLPGLATALSPDTLRDLLTEALPVCRLKGARVLRCRADVLRYRPTRRCTLRLHLGLRDRRTGATATQVLYAKLYHDVSKAASVYEEMRMLAASASLRAEGVVVPRASGFLPELAMVLQEPAVGNPLDALLGGKEGQRAPIGARGVDAVTRAAAALAALHDARLTTIRERPIAPAVERMARRADALALVDPDLGRQLRELAASLASSLERLADWGAHTGLVHGDCKPSQFLIASSQVAMLDFDHCGTADVASDLGDFTATLRQLDVRRALKAQPRNGAVMMDGSLRPLEQHFVETYRARRDRDPNLPARVTWYQASALLRKAYRAFQRSPRSSLPSALAAEAWGCLESLSRGEPVA